MTKCRQDLKCSVFLPHGTFVSFTVCDCDISWSFSLFSKHSVFRHDKILLLAKKEQVVAGIYI